MTRWRVLRLVGLGAIAATPLLASPMPPSTDAGLRKTVASVLSVARQKLMRHECRRVFLEFRDVSGETLLRKLHRLGETPQGQLMRIELRDGSGLALCNRPGTLAMSLPGQAIVLLCAEAFQKVARKSEGYTANIVIHEQLHTLGLGENPPTSEEITQRIALRCGW